MAVDDSNTKSLLHLNGSNGSTTFTDESGKTWTVSGNARIDTAQSVFGGASGYFDGNGDFIKTASNADLCTLGNGDFTIDFRVRFATVTAIDHGFCSIRVDGSNVFRLRWDGLTATTNRIKFIWADAGVVRASYEIAWTPSADTWYHIAIVRNGSTFLVFVNGVSQSITTTNTAIGTNSLNNINSDFYIGQEQSGVVAQLNGWIDEFRFTKGLARWTTNFTPPTSEYGTIIVQAGGSFLINLI